MNPKDFKLCTRDHKYLNNLENFETFYGVKKFNQFYKKLKLVRFVRNPIERLISGFIHLCYYGVNKNVHYCYGCNKNITCFVNVLEKRLWQILNHKIIPYKNDEEFHYSHHFYPQTWGCEYYKTHDTYTYIKYSSSNKASFSNNISKLLRNSYVSNKALNFIKKRINNVKIHPTVSKNETKIYKNILYNDPLLLQKVCSIYYYDFIKFDFEFPKECKNV
uniref:Carbohydrate sulfotransferase n=1 Tax=Strongyloides stercoralis TaxID=6248 RepID=A0A0K0DSB3_STRER